ncbi:hypothetical protein PCAR4_100017 [Paraburkholderia caribensis]|nr:hypothetical protein PCAR4_100017 [Paraburkholderia caribensis]
MRTVDVSELTRAAHRALIVWGSVLPFMMASRFGGNCCCACGRRCFLRLRRAGAFI